MARTACDGIADVLRVGTQPLARQPVKDFHEKQRRIILIQLESNRLTVSCARGCTAVELHRRYDGYVAQRGGDEHTEAC